MKSWIDRELDRSKFKDARLKDRFKTLVEQLSKKTGGSIPFACQDWASTKAAYRFLSNSRVDENTILGGHFEASRERFSALGGPILVLHDTTEFSFTRKYPERIGKIKLFATKGNEKRPPREYTTCGILMHSSLAVSIEGLPLGLTAVKFWTRKKFKGTNKLKKTINPARLPIEGKESRRWLDNMEQSTKLLGDPSRCVHVGDRESDIYELFCKADELKTHFVFRTCVDRLAGDGRHKVSDEMSETAIKGRHRIQITDKANRTTEAILNIKYRRIKILPPMDKRKRYPALILTVIHAQEKQKPRNRDRINWKLVTDLPVRSASDAIEKLTWYSHRWKIETFHKIQKSGCKVEELRLRTAERLVNQIAILCILSWRIFWMTMLNRDSQNLSPRTALTITEIQIIDRIFDYKPGAMRKQDLSNYLEKIACLGGYLARSNDSPPGNTVIWRGMTRLTDIELGFAIASGCG